MAYGNILVAVDTSDESDEILTAAKELMGGEACKISIVNVIEPLANFYVDLYSGLSDQGGIEVQAREYSTDRLSKLASRHGINADAVHVIVGSPAIEIRRLAEQTGADLIVLGTHGQHGLGLLLGSTANAVLHGVPCNVLVIRCGVSDT
jgi:universal stress protein A